MFNFVSIGSEVMATKEVQSGRQLVISLSGGFFAHGDGREVKINSPMSRRLIAILCRSTGMRRSRTYLQDMLWGTDVSDRHSSLRQLLIQTRKRLGDFGNCLAADSNSVSLKNVRDDTDANHAPSSYFFEDAGFGTEEFEDWLRLERQNFCDDRLEGEFSAPVKKAERYPVIGLSAAKVNYLDSRQAVVLDWVGNLFSEVFSHNDFILFSDLRKSDLRSGCDLEICVSVLPIGETFDISVALQDQGTCIWSRSKQVPSGPDLPLHRDGLLEFAQVVAAKIETLIPNLVGRWSETNSGILNLHQVVSGLFTMRTKEVTNAAELLGNFEDVDSLSSVLAWQSFANMLLSGERLVENRERALVEAESLLTTALDVDPTNPTALSIASHFQAFVKRDLISARELSDHALSIAPVSPLARDVRATLELYDDNLLESRLHAEIAERLSVSSPLRDYIGATTVMLNSLEGEHEKAIHRGQSLLLRRPRFLPVLRHVLASHLELGNLQEAEEMLLILRRLDPKFATSAMHLDEYALPSDISREFIISRLKKSGFMN